VEEAEKNAPVPTDGKAPSSADKVKHVVRHTFVTKRLINLFLRNMSENDEAKD
jgi:CPA2 family monovalent cation:H+ antiporter-2